MKEAVSAVNAHTHTHTHCDTAQKPSIGYLETGVGFLLNISSSSANSWGFIVGCFKKSRPCNINPAEWTYIDTNKVRSLVVTVCFLWYYYSKYSIIVLWNESNKREYSLNKTKAHYPQIFITVNAAVLNCFYFRTQILHWISNGDATALKCCLLKLYQKMCFSFVNPYSSRSEVNNQW